ncbi:MAG: hypothetical protein WC755_01145 [Candidatus Woesearchaeota archaeon]|jgi:hypothetical protein
MTKHLFRVNFINANTSFKEEVEKKSASFKVSDDFLSKHFPVHVFDVSLTDFCYNIPIYGRDSMVEWFDTLLVKNQLYAYPGFLDYMKNIGYNKHILPSEYLSEGGQFLFGKNFVLVSSIFKKELFDRLFKDVINTENIHSAPFYSNQVQAHIDMDYQLLEEFGIVYYDERLLTKKDEFRGAATLLERISEQYCCELRKYPQPSEGIVISKKDVRTVNGKDIYVPNIDDYTHLDYFKKFNGINFIVDNYKIFTSHIDEKERNYLKMKGADVFIVPTGLISVGAGIRCVYGEFNI